ncbi:MAG: polysaccharide deacetylase family protein [Clostridium sp.]|nr:polysaccharide deacetylase family protein [Clostridium sp.]
MKKRIFLILIIMIFGIGVTIFTKEKNSENKYYSVKSENQESTDKEEDEDSNLQNNEESNEEKKVEYINIAPEEVKIPILMYHSISSDDPDNSLMVSPELFNEQMTWLSNNGFTTMSLEEVYEAFQTGNVPVKPVAITFDDGYTDNYIKAYPILKDYGMKATFFIITNNTDKDGYYMNTDMLKEMKEYGMEIENHTAYHFELSGASMEDQKMTIEDGQAFLKENIGIESKFLCYPVGRYDDTTINLNEQLGVKAAVTTEYGFASISDGLYTLKRIRISPMSMESFSSIFSD